MAKASASRPAGSVVFEEEESKSGLWKMKSQRTMVSERGGLNTGMHLWLHYIKPHNINSIHLQISYS